MGERAAAPLAERIGQLLLDLLFPPRCVSCRREGTWLCAACIGQVDRVTGPLCPRCGRPDGGANLCPACRAGPWALDAARAPFFFAGAVQRAVHELKYRGRRVLAAPLANLLAACLPELGWPAAAIVPVPLHRQRERTRGYNQSALLARALAGQVGWPLLEGGLERWRPTRPQVGLDARARQENVRAAFRWSAASPPPERVLLLDDVYTTGATMEACAQALRQAGARQVVGLALARPVAHHVPASQGGLPW